MKVVTTVISGPNLARLDYCEVRKAGVKRVGMVKKDVYSDAVDDLIKEFIDDMHKTLELGKIFNSCAADLLTTPFSSSTTCESPNALYMQSQTRQF